MYVPTMTTANKSESIKYGAKVRISGCGWIPNGTLGYIFDEVRDGWVRVCVDGVDYEDDCDAPLLSVEWLEVVEQPKPRWCDSWWRR